MDRNEHPAPAFQRDRSFNGHCTTTGSQDQHSHIETVPLTLLVGMNQDRCMSLDHKSEELRNRAVRVESSAEDSGLNHCQSTDTCGCGIATCRDENWAKPVFGLWELAERCNRDDDDKRLPPSSRRNREMTRIAATLTPLAESKHGHLGRYPSGKLTKIAREFAKRLLGTSPVGDEIDRVTGGEPSIAGPNPIYRKIEDVAGESNVSNGDEEESNNRRKFAFPGDHDNMSYSDVSCYRKSNLDDAVGEVEDQSPLVEVTAVQSQAEAALTISKRVKQLNKVQLLTEVARIIGELCYFTVGSSLNLNYV